MNINFDFSGCLQRNKIAWLAALLMHSSSSLTKAQSFPCQPNIDFNNGNFNNWTCLRGHAQTSSASALFPDFVNEIIVPPSFGAKAIHTITSGNGLDSFGRFPVVAPGGGSYSMRLGNDSAGAGAARVQYYFHVPTGPIDYALVYKYTVVLQGANVANNARPAFTMQVKDSATGLPLDCSNRLYELNNAGSPNFHVSMVDASVRFLPWTTGTLNISNYAGKTILLELTSYDATDSSHFGYAYFDLISCTHFSPSFTNCDLGQTTVYAAAPSGFASYQWYDNWLLTGAPVFTSSSPNGYLPVPPLGSTANYYCVITPFGNNGCMDTLALVPLRNSGARVTPDSFCFGSGRPIQLDINEIYTLSSRYYYSWIADPTMSTTNIKNPIARPGRYTSGYIGCVTDSVSGCKSCDTMKIFAADFSVNLGPDIVSCIGSPLQLKPFVYGNTSHLKYSWTSAGGSQNFDDTSIKNPVYAARVAGSDIIHFSAASDICIQTDSYSIRSINVSPSLTDVQLCAGDVYHPQLIGDTDFSFTWSPNVGIPPGEEHLLSPSITANVSGEYFLTATYPGCAFIVDTLRLHVDPNPIVSFVKDTLFKCPESILPIAVNISPAWFTGFHYNWLPEENIDSPLNATVRFKGEESTTVTLVVMSPNGCRGADTLQVMIYPDEPFHALPNAVGLYPGQTYQMHPASNAISYSWFPEKNLDNPNIQQPTLTATESAQYFVIGTFENGCTAMDSIKILFHDGETPIGIPNAFAPESTLNPEFKLSYSGVVNLHYLRIFNRWGEKVFETKDVNQGWDGKYNGVAQPMGVYVYVIDATLGNGEHFYKKGNLTLVR